MRDVRPGRGSLRAAALTTALSILLVASALLAIGLGHAVVGATVTSLVAHRAGPLTTTAFSLQAAGMSLGVFVGAALGGVGLSAAGTTGLALALAVPTVIAFALVRPATRPHG